jgi:hypothetical protein
MTDASLPAGRFATGEFRIGRVISRTFSVLSRNIVKFSVVTGIGVLPTLLFPQPSIENGGNPFTNVPLVLIALVLLLVLSLLSQAIIFYGAFQDMRGRPVNLADGLQISLGRFFPLIGLGFIVFLTLIGIGIVTGLLVAVPIVKYFAWLMIIPAMMLFMAWSMGTPICVVEQVGPVRSLGRSQELTKGSRWRILGLFLVTAIPGLIISVLVGAAMGAVSVLVPVGGPLLMQIVTLVWQAIWSAFFSIILAVAYHDLRVAKEGIDTDQIAAVFE